MAEKRLLEPVEITDERQALPVEDAQRKWWVKGVTGAVEAEFKDVGELLVADQP
jgi:hypothetical protein